ncbi:hypothetical protein D929_00819 [Enterococcus faecalis 02-MB-P-10]|uniref:TcpE family conjugal transfer membrane protein n=1 Tax=Enterococcus faecalis TaxID=1351 RepID=UPI000353EF31|nr:TcpE family conjugal transfer membrane protein [Enterococcus faecalis]EPH75336.1 hypothetical protein D929_00819 [Enterococcus faecalis 02-MB-P-10]
MEYNYTREFKQPHKVYTIKEYPIPFAPNGIPLARLVFFFSLVGLVLLIGFLGLIFDLSWIKTVLTNAWLLLLAGLGLLVWTLFSLKWDNKNFFSYVWGRGLHVFQKNKRYEHELLVPFYHQKVTYQVKKKRRIK